MHIHILGICGTFMGGLALLARGLGHTVTGSDANVYPPMSTQLADAGIGLIEGYDPAQLQPDPDLVLIGNALARGNPAIEYVLNRGLPYTSGAEWLRDHVLAGRWVLACAGTHGKTTTTSILSWILEANGYRPSFLVGGVAANFGYSARLTDSAFFVIEADEYDTAFFDKRSKFVHYRPRTVILNNLEFDHADIFSDLAAIQRQFHHLIRTVPGTGRIILPGSDNALAEVMGLGCWSEVERLALGGDSDWVAELLADDGSEFRLSYQGQEVGRARWNQCGQHNVLNAVAAVAAAQHVGVRPADALAALASFEGVKRRLELLDRIGGVSVFDDFAHHPTAIATTLQGLRARIGNAPLTAVIEPRSNTMRMGTHLEALAPATREADRVMWYRPPGLDWPLERVVAASGERAALYESVPQLIEDLARRACDGEHVVIMSNGGFENIHQRLLTRLRELHA